MTFCIVWNMCKNNTGVYLSLICVKQVLNSYESPEVHSLFKKKDSYQIIV